jgi:carbamoyl-phosphate synthase large subunit
MADVIYIEPLVVDVVAKIVEKEHLDGILAGLGGQTALNMTVDEEGNTSPISTDR